MWCLCYEIGTGLCQDEVMFTAHFIMSHSGRLPQDQRDAGTQYHSRDAHAMISERLSSFLVGVAFTV